MAVVEWEEEIVRPQIRLPRLPRIVLTATRTALIVLASFAVTLVPEAWARALAGFGFFIAIYLAGWWDGRRDLAAEIVRGVRRPPRAAVRERTPEEGG